MDPLETNNRIWNALNNQDGNEINFFTIDNKETDTVDQIIGYIETVFNDPTFSTENIKKLLGIPIIGYKQLLISIYLMFGINFIVLRHDGASYNVESLIRDRTNGSIFKDSDRTIMLYKYPDIPEIDSMFRLVVFKSGSYYNKHLTKDSYCYDYVIENISNTGIGLKV